MTDLQTPAGTTNPPAASGAPRSGGGEEPPSLTAAWLDYSPLTRDEIRDRYESALGAAGWVAMGAALSEHLSAYTQDQLLRLGREAAAWRELWLARDRWRREA